MSFQAPNARNLTPYRVKAGNSNILRRIVNNQIDACKRFNGTDIAALAAYDAALHLIIWQGNHRDGRFRNMVGSTALDSERYELFRLFVCLLL